MASHHHILARGSWPVGSVRTRWREEPYRPAAEEVAAADAALAALRARDSPSHDGLSARLVDFALCDDELRLELEPARWALRLTGNSAQGMTAQCTVRDPDGRWLAGRRAPWVATWPGRWALGAAGSVEVGEHPADTLARELEEEWSVVPERLSVEALVRTPSGMVMLVGLARLGAQARPVADAEHDALAWWPADVDDWPPEADAPLRALGALLSDAQGAQ